MAGFRFIWAVAAIVVALFCAVSVAHAAPPDVLVNKGDLGISLAGDLSNAAAKGDCDCAQSLYGHTASADEYPKVQDKEVPTFVVAPAAAPPESGKAATLSADVNRFACLADGDEHWVYTQQACDLLQGAKSATGNQAKRKVVKRLAALNDTRSTRRKNLRSAACVFGAPNASGCR